DGAAHPSVYVFPDRLDDNGRVWLLRFLSTGTVSYAIAGHRRWIYIQHRPSDRGRRTPSRWKHGCERHNARKLHARNILRSFCADRGNPYVAVGNRDQRLDFGGLRYYYFDLILCQAEN